MWKKRFHYNYSKHQNIYIRMDANIGQSRCKSDLNANIISIKKQYLINIMLESHIHTSFTVSTTYIIL